MKRIAVIAVLVFGLALTAHARGGGGGGGGGGHAGGGGMGRAGGFGHAPGGAHGGGHGGGWHGGGWHGGGWHGHHHGFGSSVFIGGSFYYPWYYPAYPYYSYPYAYPYSYPYSYPYAYAYPPPDDSEWEAGPPASGGEEQPDDESAYADSRTANYGLVQLRGVPDGATVDLDGREWLHAEGLDQRWMALPDGEHVIAVRVDNRASQERRIVVKAGSSQTVRFGQSR